MLFEEIYDYFLQFTDWQTGDLVPKSSTKVSDTNPYMTIALTSKNSHRNYDKVTSAVQKGKKIAYWDKIGSKENTGICYRGTWSQIQGENIKLTVLHSTAVGIMQDTEICSRVIPLSSNLNFPVRTNLPFTTLHEEKNASGKDRKKRNNTAAEMVPIQGTIKVQDHPRYEQKGEIVFISDNKLYLNICVERLDVFSGALRDYGDAFAWVTLDWGGQIQESRRTKKSQLQHTF